MTSDSTDSSVIEMKVTQVQWPRGEGIYKLAFAYEFVCVCVGYWSKVVTYVFVVAYSFVALQRVYKLTRIPRPSLSLTLILERGLIGRL